ncbi:hypothetical protein V6N13_114279 [Hibiscus sabdariffa]
MRDKLSAYKTIGVAWSFMAGREPATSEARWIKTIVLRLSGGLCVESSSIGKALSDGSDRGGRDGFG